MAAFSVSLAAQAFTLHGRVHWAADPFEPAVDYAVLYARDAQGRTRMETIVPGAATSGEPVRVVEIHDPATHTILRLYPSLQLAYQYLYPQHPVTNPTLRDRLVWPPPLESFSVARSRPVTPLGTRTVVGIQATGRRYNRADGALMDWWRAPALGNLAVEVRVSGAGRDYWARADSIHLGDPPASWFTVPPGYVAHDLAPPPGAAEALFAEARREASHLPDPLAAAELTALADTESNSGTGTPAWRAQVNADAVTAFQRVVASAPPAHPGWKPVLEQNLVGVLLSGRAPASPQQVLALIRGADSRKAPLYGALIGAETRGPGDAPLALDPVALAAECERADGSFPYSAVDGIVFALVGFDPQNGVSLVTPRASWTQGRALLQMALAAAQRDTAPDDAASLLDFLEDVPRLPGPTQPGSPIHFADVRAAWIAAATAALAHYPLSEFPNYLNLAIQLHRVAPDVAAAPPPPHPWRPAYHPPSAEQQARDQAALDAWNAEQEQWTKVWNPVVVASNRADVVAETRAAEAAFAYCEAHHHGDWELARRLNALGLSFQADQLMTYLTGNVEVNARRAESAYTDEPSPRMPLLLDTDAVLDFPLALQAARALSDPALRPLALAAVAAAAGLWRIGGG